MSTVVAPPVEEGKMLSESLSTVKIQVSQMKRHLVRQMQPTVTFLLSLIRLLV